MQHSFAVYTVEDHSSYGSNSVYGKFKKRLKYKTHVVWKTSSYANGWSRNGT